MSEVISCCYSEKSTKLDFRKQRGDGLKEMAEISRKGISVFIIISSSQKIKLLVFQMGPETLRRISILDVFASSLIFLEVRIYSFPIKCLVLNISRKITDGNTSIMLACSYNNMGHKL